MTASTLSGEIKIHSLLASGTPSVKLSELNFPICLGGKFTTPSTSFPINWSLVYRMTRAPETFLPTSLPKSIVNLCVVYFAFGNSSTSIILPTRISSFLKSSKVAIFVLSKFKYGLENNRQFSYAVASATKMSFFVLNNNFRAKFISKVILVIKRHIRVIIGKYGNTFGEMRFYFGKVKWSAEPVLVSFLHIWIVLKSSKSFKEAGNKNCSTNHYFFRQRFKIPSNGLAPHTMPDKISIFVSSADYFGKFWNPILYARTSSFGKLRHVNIKSLCFKLFFQPREPTFFRIAIPAMCYVNSFLHRIQNIVLADVFNRFFGSFYRHCPAAFSGCRGAESNCHLRFFRPPPCPPWLPRLCAWMGSNHRLLL